MQNLFLGRFRAEEFAGETALTEYQNSVADRQNFGKFARSDNDPDPLPAKVKHQVIKLCFGTNVNASGRIVQKQDAGIGQQPTAYDALLLVSAREAGDRRFEARRFDEEPFRNVPSQLPFFGMGEHAGGERVLQRANGDVLPDVHFGKNSQTFAIFGYQSNASSTD